MKIPSTGGKSRGFALIALMCALIVILITFVAVMYWATSNGIQTRKNETFIASQAAAEGASEAIFAKMDRDYIYGSLNGQSNYQTLNVSFAMTNWPVQYTFTTTVSEGVQTTNLQYLGSQYTNLLGFPETNVITVTATPSGLLYNVPATVSQTFAFASVPAFQYAIFYNINLEIDPGASMPIQGPVFSNAGIWSGTANVTYSSTVEAVGQVSTNTDDPFVSGNAKSDSGTPQANFLYSGTPPQPESNVNPLIIPIGASSGTNDTSTNVIAIIQVPPASVCAPQAAAYQPTNQTYDFNAVSLVVSNWWWGTNGSTPWSNDFTVYLQDSAQNPTALSANWTQLTNDYYIISNNYTKALSTSPTNYVPNFRFTNNLLAINWTNSSFRGTNYVWYSSFSFLTNVTFYDYRESAGVLAVQLDVGALGAWITNSAYTGGSNWNQLLCDDLDHGINSLYIDNTAPYIGSQQVPAVRVVNGTLLPSSKCYGITYDGTYYSEIDTYGLGVATPQPLYVYGDYNVQTNGGPEVLGSTNTANTYPACFLADAITVLSSNWSDSDTSGTALTSRTPTATTINAACLEGIVPSVGGNYCGGVENFLRLLENWSPSIQLTYNGSIMVMFASEYATNLWQDTGNYYNAPKRQWSFDQNFRHQNLLPPLTPQFKTVVRNQWNSY